MNKRKLLTLAMTLCMVAILAIGGTLAYFTDTDSAKNVMTLGGVDIIQNEKLKDGTTDFSDNVPLLPRVDEEEIVFGQNHLDATKQWFNPAMKNVVDKVVTITNEAAAGSVNKDAYVRTILAFETNNEYEAGTTNVLRDCKTIFETYIGVLGKGLTYTDIVVEIGGTKYIIVYKVYEDALAAGATSEPSLKQLFMSPDAGNEISILFGDTYEVLALSQATQTAGFTSAEEALNEAFGEITEANSAKLVEWLSACA